MPRRVRGRDWRLCRSLAQWLPADAVCGQRPGVLPDSPQNTGQPGHGESSSPDGNSTATEECSSGMKTQTQCPRTPVLRDAVMVLENRGGRGATVDVQGWNGRAYPPLRMQHTFRASGEMPLILVHMLNTTWTKPSRTECISEWLLAG